MGIDSNVMSGPLENVALLVVLVLIVLFFNNDSHK